jgi:hypothetical protein
MHHLRQLKYAFVNVLMIAILNSQLISVKTIVVFLASDEPTVGLVENKNKATDLFLSEAQFDLC